MKRLLTLLFSGLLITTLAFAQNGPCTDFDNKVPAPKVNNHTGSLVTLLDNWSTRCADLAYSNTASQNGTSDVYLRGYDWGCGNAGSWLFNSIDYAGNWLNFGSCYCYDFRIFVNGNTVPAPPTNLYIYFGPDPFSATYRAKFVLNNIVTPDSGWVTICPPIELADVSGNLPSNSYGQWEMVVGSGAAAWDSLIQNVTGIGYNLDIGASPTEQYGFDNICFKNCPGDDPCSRLALDAQFDWETGDSLWTVDLTDVSTVDASGQIAWIEWCIDTAAASPAFAGDQQTITFPGPGTYDVCLKVYGFTTDSAGNSVCCKDTICETITLTICDFHNPAISVSQSPPPVGPTVTLTDVSSNGTRSIWQADTTDASTLYITTGVGTSITHTYPGPGVYTAMLVSWWHYDGVLCCIDTAYVTIRVGQTQPDPCAGMQHHADIRCTAMYNQGGSVGYIFTDESNIGTSSHWYINTPIAGVGSPITGGAGTSTGMIFFPPGIYRICLVSEAMNSVGAICRDTFCKILTVPQQPVPALCDTHNIRFTRKLGANYFAEFTDRSNQGDVTLWSFDGGINYDSTSNGAGSIMGHFFNGPGPHRVCMISIWYPYAGDTTIACRDTVCRNITFPLPAPPRFTTKIGPNPVKHIAYIQYPSQPKPVKISLINLQGTPLRRIEDDGDGEATLDVSELPEGLYMVQVTLESGEKAVVKVVKE
ncbi:MAG: T9SS type A sorting domain-containing protein [Bacteroidia bacterium]